MNLFSYLPERSAVALCKLAEGGPKNILNEAVGMGIGSIGGYAAAQGAQALYQHFNSGKKIPIPHLMAAGTAIGAGLGLAYNMAKAHQLEETQRAVEGGHHKP